MGLQEMIHVLKKGNIILSNWIEDSRMNWIKHRLFDYSEPIDSIKILKEWRHMELIWNVCFSGKNIEYVAYLFRKIYGDSTYENEDLDTVKKNIDNLLSKADKLIIFA
jgi:hypothetical protein